MRLQVSGVVGRASRPTALSRFRPFGPALLAMAAMGCFTYNNVPHTEALPGREVQVDLNVMGRTELADRIGPEVRSVTGRLAATDSSGLTVAISKTTVMNGDDNGWHGEPVVIPNRYIAQTGERTLSRGKTVVLMALLVGAASGLGLLVGHAAGASSAGSTQPVPSK